MQHNNPILENMLIEKGYTKSPNYSTIHVNGEIISIPYPFSCKLRKNKIEELRGYMPDVILCNDNGFTVVISHGGIISNNDTFIQFPKYATESNYEGALNRMEKFIEHNYENLPGLPAHLFGD